MMLPFCFLPDMFHLPLYLVSHRSKATSYIEAYVLEALLNVCCYFEKTPTESQIAKGATLTFLASSFNASISACTSGIPDFSLSRCESISSSPGK